MAHIYNPKTWEVETGRSEIQGHLCSHSKFQASLGYMNPCLNKQNRAGGVLKTKRSICDPLITICIRFSQRQNRLCVYVCMHTHTCMTMNRHGHEYKKEMVSFTVPPPFSLLSQVSSYGHISIRTPICYRRLGTVLVFYCWEQTTWPRQLS